jgi:Tfp pilus assembly protein PilO
MNALLARFAALDPKLQRIGIAVILLLIAFESWQLVLKKPFEEFRLKQQEKITLERGAAEADKYPAELVKLNKDVGDLRTQILGANNSLSTDQMVIKLVDDLASIGKRSGVKLGNVVPNAEKNIFMFGEVAFDIAAKGSYSALYNWLSSLENELGPLVVSQMEIHPPSGAEKELGLTVKLSAYHLVKDVEEVK